jgi:hypothetical protein
LCNFLFDSYFIGCDNLPYLVSNRKENALQKARILRSLSIEQLHSLEIAKHSIKHMEKGLLTVHAVMEDGLQQAKGYAQGKKKTFKSPSNALEIAKDIQSEGITVSITYHCVVCIGASRIIFVTKKFC